MSDHLQLDYHVSRQRHPVVSWIFTLRDPFGYILKEKNELYLIHSNYINSKGVQIEKVEESEVFSSYNRFFITELSTNKMLLKNWINGQKIDVVTTK